jgi:DNA mismatch repair protein MutL
VTPYRTPTQQGALSAEEGGAEAEHGPEVSACFFQLHKLYIVTQIKNGVLLIDQHAAHERVLYEKALRDLQKSSADSQQLLFPVVIGFSPAEYHILEANTDHFVKLGFDLRPFGGTSIAVDGIPSFVDLHAAEQTVRDMVAYLMDTEEGDLVVHDRIAKSFACGAAIKAGQTLSQEEMNSLFDMLFSTENPYTCPHGRPTVVRMSLDDISKRFMR